MSLVEMLKESYCIYLNYLSLILLKSYQEAKDITKDEWQNMDINKASIDPWQTLGWRSVLLRGHCGLTP